MSVLWLLSLTGLLVGASLLLVAGWRRGRDAGRPTLTRLHGGAEFAAGLVVVIAAVIGVTGPIWTIVCGALGVLYLGYAGYHAWAPRDRICGCLGEGERVSWFAAVRNLVIGVSALGAALVAGSDRSGEDLVLALVVGGCLAVLLAAHTGSAATSPTRLTGGA